MERNDIIMRVAKMIAEGKGDEIEEALDIVEENDMYDEDCDFDYEDYEDDADRVITPLTDAIRSVEQMAEPLDNAIPILPIPTVYGTVILVDFKKYKYSCEIQRLRSALPSDYILLPIEVESIKYEDGLVSEAIVFKSEMENDVVKLGIVIESQVVNNKYGYVLPINGMYAGYGAVATDLTDMANAIKSLIPTVSQNYDMIKLPEKGVKVTKNDATCKGKSYEIGTFYKHDGDLVLHKKGLHYTTEAEALKTWYRNDYLENIPWVVQSGPTVITSSSNVCVSDGLILLKQLTWDEVDEVIDEELEES